MTEIHVNFSLKQIFLIFKGEIEELQEKIHGIQLEIKAVYGDKDRAGREFQSLRQELEQINMGINEKVCLIIFQENTNCLLLKCIK